jgi:hypothetical protein
MKLWTRLPSPSPPYTYDFPTVGGMMAGTVKLLALSAPWSWRIVVVATGAHVCAPPSRLRPGVVGVDGADAPPA